MNEYEMSKGEPTANQSAGIEGRKYSWVYRNCEIFFHINILVSLFRSQGHKLSEILPNNTVKNVDYPLTRELALLFLLREILSDVKIIRSCPI
jgi:hypothetical protein